MNLKSYTLLTGSTGLLGQHLLAGMLRCRLPVAVLVRSKGRVSALERVESIVRRFETRWNRHLPRPVVLDGDLSGELRLSQAGASEWLERHCGKLLHCAANLSFQPAADHPHGEPYRTNVDGTRSLIEQALSWKINKVHSISSAYVCGLREGTVLETEQDQGQSFANDYEYSKLQAEELFRNAFTDLTISRPSIVVDDDPASPLLGDRTIYFAFTILETLTKRFGLFESGAWHRSLGLAGSERKNIVAAEWVAQTILQIFRHERFHGRTYHLTNPNGTSFEDLEEGFRDVMLERGDWIPSRAPLPSAEQLSPIVGSFNSTFSPYFRDDPTFDQTQLNEVLRALELPGCPPVGRAGLANVVRAQSLRVPASQRPQASERDGHTRTQGEWTTEFAHEDPEVESDEQRLGVILTGPGGGDWLLRQRVGDPPTLWRGGAESAPVRIYLSAENWDALCRLNTSWQVLLRSGGALIEGDDANWEADSVSQIVQAAIEVWDDGRLLPEPPSIPS